jgi:pimeloyl-ACP methyl ester carboxylesterase
MSNAADAGRMDPVETETVRGFLHRPAEATGQGLVLTHGAGSDCNAPLLVAVANAFSAAGLIVLRCDLAFRRQRSKGPPFPAGAAADRESLRKALTFLREIATAPLFLGGHSYGGRQATLLAAEEPDIAAALLLLSYPLHPPNKPAQLRTEHFKTADSERVRERHDRSIRLAGGIGEGDLSDDRPLQPEWLSQSGPKRADEAVVDPPRQRSTPAQLSAKRILQTDLWLFAVSSRRLLGSELILVAIMARGFFWLWSFALSITGAAMALSRCRTKNATRLGLTTFQATATTARHVFIAAARRVRCVWAEARWRWTLKVL